MLTQSVCFLVAADLSQCLQSHLKSTGLAEQRHHRVGDHQEALALHFAARYPRLLTSVQKLADELLQVLVPQVLQCVRYQLFNGFWGHFSRVEATIAHRLPKLSVLAPVAECSLEGPPRSVPLAEWVV